MGERCPRRDDESPVACSVVVQRYADQPDVCPIHDRGGTTPLRTTWISAEEGSFVELEDVP